MNGFDVVNLGASTATNGIPTWKATVPITGTSDVEDFGDLEVFQALGVHSVPYPATGAGAAQCVVLRGAGNSNGVAVGARDTRTADMVGNLQPGDTAVCSTHPNKSAQLVLKGEKKQAVLTTKGSDGKAILLLLDGKNDKIQLTAWGHMIEMTKSDGLTMAVGGTSIRLTPSGGYLLGNWTLGGMTPMAPIQAALTPVVGLSGATLPAVGVFWGV